MSSSTSLFFNNFEALSCRSDRQQCYLPQYIQMLETPTVSSPGWSLLPVYASKDPRLHRVYIADALIGLLNDPKPVGIPASLKHISTYRGTYQAKVQYYRHIVDERGLLIGLKTIETKVFILFEASLH